MCGGFEMEPKLTVIMPSMVDQKERDKGGDGEETER